MRDLEVLLISWNDTSFALQDAVFQRLAEDRFFDTVPTILITAKGYPDLATR